MDCVASSSDAFTYLTIQDHAALQGHVLEILRILRNENVNSPCHDKLSTSTLDIPKFLQLEVPAGTRELFIFAVSKDGQCQVVTGLENCQSALGPMRIFSEESMAVTANLLLSVLPHETSVTRRDNTIQSLADNDKNYAKIISSLGDKMQIFTEDTMIEEASDNEISTLNYSKDFGNKTITEIAEDAIEEIEGNELNAADEKNDFLILDGEDKTEMTEIESEEDNPQKQPKLAVFICKVCNEKFPSPAMLRTHYEGHLMMFWCRTCTSGYKTEKELLAHQKVSGHNYFPCEVCHKGFIRKSALLIHKRTQHTFEYYCDICNRAFVSLRSFTTHKQMHINKPALLSKGPCKVLRYYKCLGCTERFTEINSLQNHRCSKNPLEQTIKKNKPSEGKELGNNTEDLHETLEMPASESTITVSPRRKRKPQFSFATSRAKRLKFRGEVKTGITCKLCNRDFITARALRRHELLHIDFRCKKCGSVKNTREELDEHLKKPCECRCNHCGRVFKKLRELQRHEVIHQVYRPYECEVCKGKFPTQQKLRAHKQIHEEKKNLCHLCSRTFTFRQHLTRHLKAHAKGEPRKVNKSLLYHCSICSNSYHAVAILREHYDSKHRLPSFRCVNCQIRVGNYGELQNHFRDRHKGNVINCCRLCGDAFVEKKDCTQHSLEHEAHVCAPASDAGFGSEDEKRISYLFSCTNCKQMFATHAGLISHNQTHYQEPPFTCFSCNELFSSGKELDDHLPIHESSVELQSCPKCSIYVANLKLHMRQHIGKFKCTDCGKCLKTKQGLLVHSFLHTGEKPFLCNDCGLQFNNSGKLINHRRIHGDGSSNNAAMARQTSYTCSMCKQKFWRPSAFLLHLYSYHKQPCCVKKHVCTYCQREFVKKSNLTNHLRMHKDEKGAMKKEFSCSKCSRTFSTKAHQIIHTQMHDSEDLVCPICSKQFTSLVCLQVHMRTHTGECPSCEICNKQFAAMKYLKKHMISHSGDRYRVVCCFCDVLFPSQRACIRHLKESHSEFNPGICNSCGWGFVKNEDLENHLATCKSTGNAENPAEIAMGVVTGLEQEQPVAELDAGAILETSDAVIQICTTEDQQMATNVTEFGDERTLIMDLPTNVDGANVTIPANAYIVPADDSNMYYHLVFQ